MKSCNSPSYFTKSHLKSPVLKHDPHKPWKLPVGRRKEPSSLGGKNKAVLMCTHTPKSTHPMPSEMPAGGRNFLECSVAENTWGFGMGDNGKFTINRECERARKAFQEGRKTQPSDPGSGRQGRQLPPSRKIQVKRLGLWNFCFLHIQHPGWPWSEGCLASGYHGVFSFLTIHFPNRHSANSNETRSIEKPFR